MKILKCLIVTISIQNAIGQNLVPNNSFEFGNIHCLYILDKNEFASAAWGWTMPTNGTSDIFDTQIPNKSCWASMPAITGFYDINPYVGSQLPHTGNRFAGIFTFCKGLDPSENPDTTYREYLQVELQSALIPGEYYCAEMFASMAEQPKYAANNLGILFLTEQINVYNWQPLIRSPQVVEKEIIKDTINWVKISGAFKAQESYKYLIVGNFFYNGQTAHLNKGGKFPNTYSYNYAYYFVDDVSVKKITPGTFALSGKDTICWGGEASIHATGEFDDITWTTLEDPTTIIQTGGVLTVSPTATTSYRVVGSNCKWKTIDTVNITVRPRYLPDLGKDTTICDGATLLLDPGDFDSYQWQNKSTQRSFLVKKQGTYNVVVTTSKGCSETDEIVVTTLAPPSVNFGESILICDDYVDLVAGKSLTDSYNWSTSSIDPSIRVSSSGKYWVTALNRCGSSTDSTYVYSMSEIFIPNVITPNNDGLNEKFVVMGLGPEINGRLEIVNRWGDIVFKTDHYKNDWPFENQIPAVGIYFYTLDYPKCRRYKGWLHVVR